MAKYIIETHHNHAPIPIRLFDWMAVLDNYEAGDPVGYGETEIEAAIDLLREIEARKE